MTELCLVKKPGNVFVPADDETEASLKHLKIGSVIAGNFRQPRNYKFHKKFMAMVAFVADMHPVYNTHKKALLAIKIAMGHCDFVAHPITGELIPEAKSISFASMDEIAFADFYQDAVNATLAHLTPGVLQEDIDRFVDTVAHF